MLSNTKLQVIEQLNNSGHILIKTKGKIPMEVGWQNRTHTTPAEAFCDSDNIGTLLGRENGFIDIDIDDTSALAIADRFLPPTEFIYGRKSRPRSHRFYLCADPQKTRQFQTDQGMIVEVRGKGSQTVLPESFHPSGEKVEFDSFGNAAEATFQTLVDAAANLAIATVLEPHWKKGQRHHLALALSSALGSCGWSKKKAGTLIIPMFKAFNDEEGDDRVQCVKDTFANKAFSTKGLEKIVGHDLAETIIKWSGGIGVARNSVKKKYEGNDKETQSNYPPPCQGWPSLNPWRDGSG